MKLTEKVKEVGLSSGLDLVGIAPADSFEGYRWEDSVMRDPKLSMPEARSLVIVGVCDLKKLRAPQTIGLMGRVARSYAAGHEFDLVRELDPIKELLEAHGYQAHISPGSIAESTIPLKLAAVRAGLGWQGKHSVVITPEYGSWVTFGGLMTNAPLDYDTPLGDENCGRCTACIDACPMGAIQAPYIVEMSACIDDILNRPGHIPDEIKHKIGNRIISCDTCLEVCPHSAKVLKKTTFEGSLPYEFDCLELLNINEAQFNDIFGKLNWSIDIVTLKRNVILALGNSGDRLVWKELERYTLHESEVLQNMAQWALKKLHSA
ncbi:MAG: epoxyqueuosine reductase [Acidobacteriota bacterium]